MTIEFAPHPIGSDDFVARMTADMRSTGWHIHKAHETTINKYQILGERGCGTNIVRKTMQRTLNPTRRGYAPQTRRMGNAWSKTAETRHPLPEDWSLEDAEWMYSQLDPQLEDILGFGPD